MERLVIHSSRRRLALGVLGCVAFVALGYWIDRQASTLWERGVGWAAMLFFGFCLVPWVRQLFDSSPRLVIDESGIYDRTMGVGRIPWAEITSAAIQSVHRSDFICLTVRNPEMWLSQLSPLKRRVLDANRALGFGDLAVNLAGTGADIAEVHKLILRFLATS